MKVLIAEDEPALLDSFCEIVLGLGHDFVAARDGEEALQLAAREHPALVVTDMMMPRLGGVELARSLGAEPTLAGTPIILMSAARPSSGALDLVWRFLPKPVSIDAFEQAVEAGLQLASVKERGAGAPKARQAGETAPDALLREAMLSWVAHEIKSPLSAALTANELALRGVRNGAEARDIERRLLVISRQLVRMDELVASILDAARLQDGKLSLELADLELGTWLQRVIEFWKELHPTHRFELSDSQTLQVRVDQERVRQILDNLISNAIKYGGDAKVVRVSVTATSERVAISISDQGRGIAAEELPNIFNRFHRIAGEGGRGHGLGLYIAASLARLHGGDLTVQSEMGRGSTFTLSLPPSATPAQ